MIRKQTLLSIVLLLLAVSGAYAAPASIVSPAPGARIPANIEFLDIVLQGAGDDMLLRLDNGDRALHLPAKASPLRIEGATLAGLDRTLPVTLRLCSAADSAACSPATTVTFVDAPLTGTVQFRVVEPLFNPGQLSEVLRIDLQSGRRDSLYSTDQVCIGCHAYSRDGKVALNVKRGKDRRLVIFTSDAAGPKLVTSRKLSEFAFVSWSPSGNQLALVANSFGVIDIRPEPVSPFDLVYHSGDLAILDMASGQVKPLPGASELHFVEDMPVWRPDGQELLYVRYRVDKGEPVKGMDIFRIPYNAGNGGKATPLLPPAAPGQFRFLPAYSPDGKWISYVQGDGSQGVFARPSSDIWLVPAKGGEPRRLELNADGVMDSWHQWSENGRWLLFAAKRGDNATRLMASYIDGNGETSPPFALAEVAGRKINIPQYQAANTTVPLSLAAFNQIIDQVYSTDKTE